jgi:hypothetical protein
MGDLNTEKLPTETDLEQLINKAETARPELVNNSTFGAVKAIARRIFERSPEIALGSIELWIINSQNSTPVAEA